MTDYLELLLEFRQDEEDAETFVWKRAKVRHRGLEEGLLQPKGTQTAAQEQIRQEERKPGEWEARWDAAAVGTDLVRRLAVLERAIGRGKQASTAWERKQERAELAPVTGGADMRRLRTAAPGVQRDLAAMLDTAFERDARRYDGPLGLF